MPQEAVKTQFSFSAAGGGRRPPPPAGASRTPAADFVPCESAGKSPAASIDWRGNFRTLNPIFRHERHRLRRPRRSRHRYRRQPPIAQPLPLHRARGHAHLLAGWLPATALFGTQGAEGFGRAIWENAQHVNALYLRLREIKSPAFQKPADPALVRLMEEMLHAPNEVALAVALWPGAEAGSTPGPEIARRPPPTQYRPAQRLRHRPHCGR